MRRNIKLAIGFSEKIKNLKGILSIVLFGSVARGDDNISSDVDIAIIHERKDESSLREKINEVKPERVQVTILNIKDLPKETEIVGALSGEGLLLHGNPIIIKERELNLRPKLLLNYTLSNLEQKEKVKVSRALYGYVSYSKHKGKNYKSEIKGIVEELGIKKMGRGLILADRRKAQEVINVFKKFNIMYKELPVWTY